MDGISFPDWVTSNHFRPTNMAVNLTRMRTEATKTAVKGGYAVIHHHDADDDCLTSYVHEYFGFGPHEKCDALGCDDCDGTGWRKHG